VGLDIASEGEQGLWLDASRSSAGLYLLSRRDLRRLSVEEEASKRTRHALLHLRKHLSGRRVSAIRRVAGERTIVLEAGTTVLVLRLSGAAAATLAVDGVAVTTFGEGREAWPIPMADAEREASWAVAAGSRPTLRVPAPLDAVHDADLVPARAVELGGAGGPGGTLVHPPTWRESAVLFLEARLRASRFDRGRRVVLGAARTEARRLARLEEHLARDIESLPDAVQLRRSAEALLAAPEAPPPGALEAHVADPYAPESRITVPLDPRLSLRANADRLFEKARRVERARKQVEARLAETRRALELAREREGRADRARDLSDVDPPLAGRRKNTKDGGAGPRHYLSSRGLSILVGRGARENHHLTFAVARPEDLWLHARDVPGAHVILRDNEGRAGPEDQREAAEVAAFFSDAAADAAIDVHVTRRKHVRAAGGGPGRVKVAYSETLRVAPRDPEGRLRRR
jgi:predicted ribosome quality control (RQC) complex YloA/Tae2 family protein